MSDAERECCDLTIRDQRPEGMTLDMMNEAIRLIREWEDDDRLACEVAVDLFQLFKGAAR